jgi:anti-sigma regulatory factor (Ser/Thr protein kinase)
MGNKIGNELNFGETLLGSLGIVITEIATNLYKHAKQGELILRALREGEWSGVEVLSVDRGPGISDVSKCLEDGFSTAGTKGNGLGSIKRLSTVFDFYSNPQGTVLLAQIWNRAPNGIFPQLGAVCIPYPGEHVCGDAWAWASTPTGHVLITADGLGHGKDAAGAADLAIEVFKESPGVTSALLLQALHSALRSTRGAAISILELNSRDKKIMCSGIGNISSGCVVGDSSKSFVSLNGTIGHHAQRFQEFSYDWPPASLIVVHSDGLQSKWKLSAYPGLQMRHPGLAAGVLYRDFRRDRDDVTVIVIK